MWFVNAFFCGSVKTLYKFNRMEACCAHRFEVFVASFHLANPITAEFATSAPLGRGFFDTVVGVGLCTWHTAFRISLLVKLLVGSEASLRPERLVFAIRMGTRWRMGRSDVLL